MISRITPNFNGTPLQQKKSNKSMPFSANLKVDEASIKKFGQESINDLTKLAQNYLDSSSTFNIFRNDNGLYKINLNGKAERYIIAGDELDFIKNFIMKKS